MTGADDAAELVGTAAGAVTEDDAQASVGSGALAVSDPDTELTADDAAFVAQTKEGVYGTFTLGADGTWTYVLDNADADTNALGAQETATEQFTVQSGSGVQGVVVVTVTGADDAAVIGGDLAGEVTEDDASSETAMGTLTVRDPDTALAAMQREFTTRTEVAGEYGTFTLAANGEWTYELDNADADTEALVAGEMVTERFTVASADGTTGVVVVTVTGADDAAKIVGSVDFSVLAREHTSITIGKIRVVDPDDDVESRFRKQIFRGVYGDLLLTKTGLIQYSIVGDNPAVRALSVGEEATDRFSVWSVGGVVGEVVITVIGRDDAAQIADCVGGERWRWR